MFRFGRAAMFGRLPLQGAYHVVIDIPYRKLPHSNACIEDVSVKAILSLVGAFGNPCDGGRRISP